MYSIAKLIDEPQKVESLIISILKILITAWIGTEILGFEFSPNDISLETLNSGIGDSEIVGQEKEEVTFDQIIYLVLTIVGLWYLIWTVIAELLLGGLIKLLSRIGKPEKTLRNVLSFTKVISTDKDGNTKEPEKNIIRFESIINSEEIESEFLDIDDIRTNQYFFVGLFGFLILLYSDEVTLNGWELTIACIVLPSVFISSIIIQKCFNYLNYNLVDVRKEYNPLAHAYKVRKAINSNETLNKNFKIDMRGRKVILTKTAEHLALPNEIIVNSAYCPNDKIGLELFKDMFKKDKNTSKHFVFITNVLSNEQLKEFRKDNFEVISGSTEEEIYHSIEMYLYQKRKDIYQAKKLLEDA